MEINPTGTVPTLQEGNILLIGGYSTQIEYLMHMQNLGMVMLNPPALKSKVEIHL